MSLRNLLRLVVTMGICGTVGQGWGYDASPNTGGSLDACTQVIFEAFTPPPFSQDKNNKEIAPKSEFSFLASKAANPQRITVKIKDENVPITVTPMNNGFLIKGKIPATVKGSFIRVDIYAKGPNDCDKADGWLLKVGN